MPVSVMPDAASVDADLRSCRRQLRGGSRSFLAASLLLPRDVRDSASALYAFCRSADDAVDLDETDAHGAVERLQLRLARLYEGDPAPAAADRAMARVVVRHAIPRALPQALIEGFAWDAQGRRYATLEALQDYAARVAGSVGAMMALLMGVRSPAALARAADLGTAMQLSNIARDVGEDARRGRVYLPLRWLEEAGVDPDAFVADPRFEPGVAVVVRRLVSAADGLYADAAAGIARLPARCRPAIHAASWLYREIGHEVLRRDADSVTGRAVVSPARKLLCMGRAVADVLAPADLERLRRPPLPANAFLVDAASRAAPSPDVAARSLPERVAWMIELFERQEARRRRLPVPTHELPAHAPH